MVFANDLWLHVFIGRFKATLPHPIWIEHLAKRVMFFFFLGLQTPLTPPPPPSLTEGMMEVSSREAAAFKKNSGSAYAIVQQHFFHNILQGISVIYTNNKLHNSVIPRKTEFSKNCLSPRPQPNIEKNAIWIQRFLYLNSDVTLWSVKWKHFG